jgi:hypothetical protein
MIVEMGTKSILKVEQGLVLPVGFMRRQAFSSGV